MHKKHKHCIPVHQNDFHNKRDVSLVWSNCCRLRLFLAILSFCVQAQQKIFGLESRNSWRCKQEQYKSDSVVQFLSKASFYQLKRKIFWQTTLTEMNWALSADSRCRCKINHTPHEVAEYQLSMSMYQTNVSGVSVKVVTVVIVVMALRRVLS